MLEPLSQRLVVLRSAIDEPLRVDRCLTTVVGHNRQIELGQADRHSLSHTIFGRETYMAEGRKIASAASRNGVMAGPVKH